MGFFGFLKKHVNEEKVEYGGTTFWAPKPISNEEYQKKRQQEVEWLEAHYDLNSANGINSIPERRDLPRPTFGDSNGFRSYTGDIDYYLRRKSAEYEEAGNTKLAILCLKKSNAIRMMARRGYRKDDYYTYVRLLARSGFVDDAKAEKIKIDNFFGEEDIDAFITTSRMNSISRSKNNTEDDMIEFEAKRGVEKRNYKWIQANLPEVCPKSFSGYMRMKNSNTKNYQKLVMLAKDQGRGIG